MVYEREEDTREVPQIGEDHASSELQEHTHTPYTMEVDHNQAYAFSPFLFAIIIDSLNTRKGAPWQVMLVYDVVLCEMEKRVLEVDLDQWRTALEKNWNEGSKATANT